MSSPELKNDYGSFVNQIDITNDEDYQDAVQYAKR